jgi:hypothetical protein
VAQACEVLSCLVAGYGYESRDSAWCGTLMECLLRVVTRNGRTGSVIVNGVIMMKTEGRGQVQTISGLMRAWLLIMMMTTTNLVVISDRLM